MLMIIFYLFLISFAITVIVTPVIAKFFLRQGISGKDMNKLDKPVIPEMGGVAILIGFFSSIFCSGFPQPGMLPREYALPAAAIVPINFLLEILFIIVTSLYMSMFGLLFMVE